MRGARSSRPSRSASAPGCCGLAGPDKPSQGPHLAPIRPCIESIFWTLRDRLGLELHRTRALVGLLSRIAAKLLALAAGVSLNHQLGRPTRAFAALAA
jgi:hypothetical protein